MVNKQYWQWWATQVRKGKIPICVYIIARLKERINRLEERVSNGQG